MAAPAFSRLQLAAALLEYDNDPDDPDSPQVNAKESAIFASLRRPAPPPRVLQQQPDDDEDEDVPLSHAAHIRNVDVRKSMVASLVNVEPEDLERAADDEMLSSWGLDGLVEKAEEKKDKRPAQLNLDKDKLASLGIDDTREPPSRALSVMLPNPHGPPTPTDVNMSPIQRYPPKRPLSMGDMDGLVIGVSPERRRNPPEAIDYRQSMAGTLDFAAPAPANPGPGEVALTTPELLVFPAKDAPQSSPGDGSPNPFAIPLPETTRRSRFDPKALSEERRLSIGSMGQLQRPEDPEDQAAQDASTDYLGSNLPNSRARAHSMGTMQTQAMLDADEPTPLPSPAAPEAKRLTRLDLLRPKVLVMPSPLQDKKADSKKTRDGFFTTDDGGFPLPIGSRPEARPGLAPLAGSVSNPRLSMSLSQLTFRQSLMVGGQRDPSYFDIDKNLRTAAEEGERADQGWSEEEDEDKELRPAGKLYGKSLIDNLEARKAVIKGKQRVFTGDQRSAMMQRPGMTRSSTLIDASTFGNSRPATQYLSPSQVQEDARRKRASGAPLVDFSSEVPPGPNSRPGMPASRSVFGVDKVWERELAKLKALEEQEKEEQGKMKALDARLDDKRQQAAMTRSASANLDQRASALLPDSLMPTPPLGGADSDEERRPPLGSRRESAASLGARGWFNSPGSDDETEEDKRASFVSTNTMRPPAFSRKISAGNKLPQIPSGGDDSEEEDIPLAQQAARRSMMPPRQTSKSFAPVDSDSDEDKPIAVLKRHQSKSSAGPSGLSKIGLGNDGPFSAELGLGASAFSPGKGNTAAKGGDDSSEDEVPLGVRHPTANRLSSMPTKAESDEDEDDKPLGAKFAASNAFQQQQAMQQQALLQQQMMQQQMMMQQAMRTSMFGGSMMNPSVMGSGFFPAPVSMHSMNVNALAVAQEAQTAQLSRVDQWRRDVVQ